MKFEIKDKTLNEVFRRNEEICYNLLYRLKLIGSNKERERIKFIRIIESYVDDNIADFEDDETGDYYNILEIFIKALGYSTLDGIINDIYSKEVEAELYKYFDIVLDNIYSDKSIDMVNLFKTGKIIFIGEKTGPWHPTEDAESRVDKNGIDSITKEKYYIIKDDSFMLFEDITSKLESLEEDYKTIDFNGSNYRELLFEEVNKTLDVINDKKYIKTIFKKYEPIFIGKGKYRFDSMGESHILVQI